MTLPIRLRLTLWYSALLAGALLLFSGTVYAVMADTLVNNLDASLHGRITQVAATVDISNGHLSLPGGGEQGDTPFIPTVLLTPAGHLVSGLLPPALRHWLSTRSSPFDPHFRAATFGGLRLATAPISDNGRAAGYVLVWQPLKSVDEARRSLLLVMGAAGPALLILAGLGGFALARRALAPVARITHTASTISVSDLHQRVPVVSAGDELSELASTFNAMIDRLEAAVHREREFTGDASHELRSPLAVIRAETTLALERPRTQGAYEQALRVIDEQASAMEELIAALLLLARVETLRSLPTEELSLLHLVQAAIDQSAPTLERTRVALDVAIPPDLLVVGTESLLTRAIRNILDNAIKVSPAGDVVQVCARQKGQEVELLITDHGPGLAAHEHRRIFDPFYQVAANGSMHAARTPGESHGLGLAICQRIIRAHHGTVAVRSTPGQGATFSILLPGTTVHSGDNDG